MVLKYFIVSTMAIQKTIMYHHNASIMMMAYFLFGSKERVVWKFDRPSGYVSQFLLGSYNAKMFKDRVRVSKPTFYLFMSFAWTHVEQERYKIKTLYSNRV